MTERDTKGNQEYITRRTSNQTLWADKAQLHGTGLEATAATAWVQAGTLRRLRRIVRPTDRILEVGCGNGNLLGPLAKRCCAIGIDLTPEMLRVAQAHEKHIRGLARGDAAWLPFRDKSFDVVYTSRCLINVQDPGMQALALEEILRVAKADGTVVLSENFQEPIARLNRAKVRFWAGPPDKDDYNLRLNLESTLRLCRERGWLVTRIDGFPMSSFLANVVLGQLTRRRGGWIIFEPLFRLVARLDDVVAARLPHFGKDTTITLTRAVKE